MFDGKGRKCASVGQVPHRYYFPVPPIFFPYLKFFVPNFFSYLNLCSYPNCFRSQFFCSQIFFRTQICFIPKLFSQNCCTKFFFRTNIHNCGDCGDVDKLNLMLLYPSSQKHRHTSTVSTLIIACNQLHSTSRMIIGRKTSHNYIPLVTNSYFPLFVIA